MVHIAFICLWRSDTRTFLPSSFQLNLRKRWTRRDRLRSKGIPGRASNRDAERKAAEVRIRAERKTGELVKEAQRSGKMLTAGDNGGAHRGKQKSPSNNTSTLRDLGISYDQSSKWQRLAEIPEEKFNEALANPHVIPSTDGVPEIISAAMIPQCLPFDRR